MLELNSEFGESDVVMLVFLVLLIVPKAAGLCCWVVPGSRACIPVLVSRVLTYLLVLEPPLCFSSQDDFSPTSKLHCLLAKSRQMVSDLELSTLLPISSEHLDSSAQNVRASTHLTHCSGLGSPTPRRHQHVPLSHRRALQRSAP